MNITVNEELKAYIDPLTPDEHAALERSILAEGCRDALVLWGDVLVDGHNRYGICQKHGLPFQTVQNTRFQSMEDVHLWMIDQHLGRRSVSDFQRGVLALRKREILTERRTQAIAATAFRDEAATSEANDAVPEPNPLKSRTDIAKAARLSNSQVVQIEKIQKQAAPELVAAVKSGVISINAAAAVASLPAEEQKSAALGGKDELKQAAKRVREVNRKTPPDTQPSGESDSTDAAPTELQALQAQVAALTAENQALRAQVAQLQAQLAV
ncbi:plasmid replication/partition related protein [Limnohabitans sp.]|uniref:plasmid replication/partition related protein n=1 Tax=Limnohabitans sp. TaxID=1907725 RepID=UPI0025BE1F08|nr:plasmid replication/partition related protein [Limnohabitans sp.]